MDLSVCRKSCSFQFFGTSYIFSSQRKFGIMFHAIIESPDKIHVCVCVCHSNEAHAQTNIQQQRKRYTQLLNYVLAVFAYALLYFRCSLFCHLFLRVHHVECGDVQIYSATTTSTTSSEKKCVSVRKMYTQTEHLMWP